MTMEAASLAALAADRDTWRAPRQQCLAPSSACESEIQIEAEMRGAPLGAPRAAGMTRACHAHYAGVFCDAVVRQHGARPGVGWGQTPAHARLRWARLGSPTPTLTLTPTPALTLSLVPTLAPTLIRTTKARLGCDKHSVAEDFAFFHPEKLGAPATAPAAAPATAPAAEAAAEAAVALAAAAAAAAAAPPPPRRAVDAGRVHCVAPSNGALLLSSPLPQPHLHLHLKPNPNPSPSPLALAPTLVRRTAALRLRPA